MKILVNGGTAGIYPDRIVLYLQLTPGVRHTVIKTHIVISLNP